MDKVPNQNFIQQWSILVNIKISHYLLHRNLRNKWVAALPKSSSMDAIYKANHFFSFSFFSFFSFLFLFFFSH